jgi:hypothetical protein
MRRWVIPKENFDDDSVKSCNFWQKASLNDDTRIIVAELAGTITFYIGFPAIALLASKGRSPFTTFSLAKGDRFVKRGRAIARSLFFAYLKVRSPLNPSRRNEVEAKK